MKRVIYPFAAIVGLRELKLALMLGAVDGRLSVLLRGDKGAGKTTAARAIAELLPDDSPFVNLPLGATEDRLLGGLDLDRTMKGEPILKPGLLAESHGGVVYIDEVNLLPDHLADSLLDVAAGGVMFLEREGFSESRECQFLLLGSMNPEEGGLRPQLLDRFALVADVHAPRDPVDRRCVVERRLKFDADPQAFLNEWAGEQQHLQAILSRARESVGGVFCPPAILDWISQTVSEHNVRSLRADIAIVRASMVKAALEGSDTVSEEHVQAVLPLVLAHRAKSVPQPPPPDRPGSSTQDREQKTPDNGAATGERIFPSRPVEMPRVVTTNLPADARGASKAAHSIAPGPVVSVRRNVDPVELDPRASVARALVESGQAIPRQEDLHERIREPYSETRFLFVVDSSGSHGAKDRMRLVKGAVTGLLEASSKRRDEVVVLAFRGTNADVVIEPTRSTEAVRQALEYLPTGGRTPLAHGLELALQYITQSTVLVLLTDGRANVPSKSEDAWKDALQAAQQVRCPALVIDTEDILGATGRPLALANAMNAKHMKLDAIGDDRELILTLQALR